MRYLLLIALLVGCAQTRVEPLGVPIVPVRVEPQAQQMSRSEVVSATIQCEQDGLRAVPVMSKRIISGMYSDIAVSYTHLTLPTKRIV